MCRAIGEGGRRCLGCQGPSALAKHNDRRRKNRAIRRNAAAWARQQGVDPAVVAQLEKEPPNVAKAWLQNMGQNPEAFASGVPGQAGVPLGAKPATGAGPNVIQAPPAVPLPGAGGGTGGAPARGGAVGRGGGGVAGNARPVPTPPSGQSWSTPELQRQIAAAQQLQGGHRDERSMLSGKPERVKATKGGTNKTMRVELDNGVTGYFKPFSGERSDLARGFGQDSRQQGIHEAAAWRLASQMGPPWSDIVPPVVIREVGGEMGSFGLERPGKDHNWGPWNTGEWREAAFFDTLIGQQDRHPGNYLIAGDRITLIDHGYTFARPGDYENYSWLRRERLKGDPSLTYAERDVLQRLVASPDLLGMGKILQPDRAAALKARAERMLSDGRLTDQY